MWYQKCQKKQEKLIDVENFLQQMKQGPCYVCTIFHWSLYQRSVRLLMDEKYHKLFDAKLYICHKHLCKNEITCQIVCDKVLLEIRTFSYPFKSFSSSDIGSKVIYFRSYIRWVIRFKRIRNSPNFQKNFV